MAVARRLRWLLLQRRLFCCIPSRRHKHLLFCMFVNTLGESAADCYSCRTPFVNDVMATGPPANTLFRGRIDYLLLDTIHPSWLLPRWRGVSGWSPQGFWRTLTWCTSRHASCPSRSESVNWQIMSAHACANARHAVHVTIRCPMARPGAHCPGRPRPAQALVMAPRVLYCAYIGSLSVQDSVLSVCGHSLI